MIIDTIKISQEINFNGMPTWVSIGGTLLPEDNVLDGLRQLQKSITDYQTEEAKAYSQSKEIQIRPVNTPKMSPDEALIQAINNCTVLDGDNGLLTYRLPASLNPSTKAAYDLKLSLLKK